MTTQPVRELPKVTAGSSAASAAAIARVATRASAPPVVESTTALRRPEPVVPVKRTPAAPAGREATEMTLADLVKMVDKRKNGVREVYANDATDQDELIESSDKPIVLSHGSQASLVARMLGRR